MPVHSGWGKFRELVGKNALAFTSTERPTQTTATKDKRRSLARAALFVTATFALTTTAIAQAPPGSLWYNGDFDSRDGLINERGGGSVYDDFNVTDPLGWNVAAVFSDDLFAVGFVVTGADWEIRTGVSEGNAGTLIASGTTNSPVVTPTGRSGFGYTEHMVEVTGLNVVLPMLPPGQHYWLNVTPAGYGTSFSYNSTTSGANCVGTPCGNDDNAFFNSIPFGAYFTNTLNECSDCHDFSNGVIGTVVPEPATVALLTFGLGALLIALRRRRALARAAYSLTRRAALPALFVAAALVLNTTVIAQAPPGAFGTTATIMASMLWLTSETPLSPKPLFMTIST